MQSTGTDNLVFIKIKNLCNGKGTVNRMKKQPINRKKDFKRFIC